MIKKKLFVMVGKRFILRKNVEFLDIEHIFGLDILTFNYKGKTYKSPVFEV